MQETILRKIPMMKSGAVNKFLSSSQKFTVNEFVTHITLVATYHEGIREVYLIALQDKRLGKPVATPVPTSTATTKNTTNNNILTENQQSNIDTLNVGNTNEQQNFSDNESEELTPVQFSTLRFGAPHIEETNC